MALRTLMPGSVSGRLGALLYDFRNTYLRFRNRIAYRRRSDRIPEVTVEEPKNVLVLTVDCLRNDRLSRTGYDRNTTPFLDTLSEYTPAISAAPWTYSSVPSILTGRYPHRHGAVYPSDDDRNQDMRNPPRRIDDDVWSVAELLASAGYSTLFATAIGTAEIPLRGRFETSLRMHDEPAEGLLRKASEWWANTNGARFAYVQLGDLHAPIRRPETEYFGPIPEIENIESWDFEESVTPPDEFERFRKARSLLYDSVLRSVDVAIESFLDSLDEREDTIVIVTSDHGEEFWEYRDFERRKFEDPRGIAGVGHGHALVPPVIEVPILADGVDFANASGRSSTTDIVPTILQSVSGTFDTDLDGVPLQDPSFVRPLLSEEIAYGPNQLSVVDGDDHLIYVPARDKSILLEYGTTKERDDAETIARLKELLPESKRVGDNVEIDAQTEQQLADLGYTE